MDVVIAHPLELPARLEVRGRGPGRRRQRRRCSRRERSHVARRHPRLRVPVVVVQIVGIFVGMDRLHGRRVERMYRVLSARLRFA